MGVEDTLEGLRTQVEELVSLLAHGEGAHEAAAGPNVELERNVARLAGKLDQAGELLAMLTDLLEAQAERLEAVEERVEELSVAAMAEPSQPPVRAVEPDPPPQESLERLAEREIAGRGIKAGRSHPTILVVDDLPEARTVLSIYLSKTGYQVVTASSAEDCLAKLMHHEIDAIVLDAELSGANGGHVLRVIKEEDAYASKRAIPVIVYTAYPDRVGRKQADEWGATEYVVKGGDMLPLMSALIRHTSGTGRDDRAEA